MLNDKRRRQILDAALRCFRESGFRGASVSDICKVAGMSPGHLYHYFPSKEAIVASCRQPVRHRRLHPRRARRAGGVTARPFASRPPAA
ncbi:TetR/AcrR family transcriptional regulator [Leptolyngbya sp. 15MV]|nr:TetR/AcrR family transcriptional regulator [Leptolyngbya sp. 15MV]